MINEYAFNYGYDSQLNKEVDTTFKVNNHKVSADIYFKLFRKARKNYKRLKFHKVLKENYNTNRVIYSEYTTFKRSIND
jgi:hypothetical protein